MEIPIQAQVECTDGVFGRSVCVLINPIDDHVVDFVAKGDVSPNIEYIVPVGYISETKADAIRLKCSMAELTKMEPFVQTRFIKQNIPDRNMDYVGGMIGMGAFYFLPYVSPEMAVDVPVEELQIPAGESAVNRGTRVEAKDGYVGKIDEFVIDPKTDKITHLVLREGHLWGKRDVMIPVSSMDKVEENTVFLKLDKKQVEGLPVFPIQRRWS